MNPKETVVRSVKIIDPNPHEGEVMPFDELILDFMVFLRERRGAIYVSDLWKLGTALAFDALRISLGSDPDIRRDNGLVTWVERIGDDVEISVTMPVPEYTGKHPDLTEEDVAGDVAAAKALWQVRCGLIDSARNPEQSEVVNWLGSMYSVAIDVLEYRGVTRKVIKLTWRRGPDTPPFHVHGDNIRDALKKAMDVDSRLREGVVGEHGETA